ncbi:TspO/MBR family protein [Lacisediminihabitans changchengi]|uniref:TspO/MBR family protein n=1 Tax=Lacisediminihabitans changchengi TaxID=2787634 RepID=UPI0027DBF084|nr:TspO/MBR family protein [Lacisediminihabitans changchengi]
MARDVVRQVIVLVSAVIAVVGSFIGSGAAGGTPIQDAAGGALAADATTIAPAGPAFSIWSVIYVGLIAYAIWQLLPRQRSDPRQRVLGYPIAVTLVLNAAWILSIQFGFLALSVPIIVVLLAALIWTFFLTLRTRPKGVVEAAVADGTVGLYLGWVCVATAANITAYLVAAGFAGGSIPRDVWSVVIVAVAGAVGVLLALRGRGRLAPAASLGWGLAWVAVARLGGEPFSVATGIAAIAAVIIVVVTTISIRVRVS